MVIVQDDSFDATQSIAICAFTTDESEAPLFRLLVKPNGHNGLLASSRLMVDKITTMPRANLRDQVGRLPDADLVRLDRALVVFLGLAE